MGTTELEAHMLTRCIADFSKYDMTYYLKGALAGGICCSFTHGALCPVDVVKTRMQLEPEVLVPRAFPPPFTACMYLWPGWSVVLIGIYCWPQVYNKGMIGGFRQVIAGEGVGALATGLGPTVVGYFVQGWFKFGGVEVRLTPGPLSLRCLAMSAP